MGLRATVVLAVVVVLLACTKRKDPATGPVPETLDAGATDASSFRPAPSASIDLAPSADPSWQNAPPQTWVSARVLEGLTADCDFLPPERARTDGESGTPADLFRCTTAYEQACVFDPCLGADGSCNERCSTTCRSCGETCSTSCKACKAGCTDDACKRTCAMSCAVCKQACTRTMDRCSSGDCSRAHVACRKAIAAAYQKNHCAAPCKVFKSCFDTCSAAAGPDCWDTCRTKIDATFEPCREKCDGNADCLVKCYLSGCSSNLCEGI